MASADNCTFTNVRAVRYVASVGSNSGLVFAGGATALEAARGNVITGISSKEIFAEGTTTKVVASYNNRILIDKENFSTVPAVDTGASLLWKNEVIPTGSNIIQHDNGWYEVFGLVASIPASSTVVVNLPFSFDSTTEMYVFTTIRTSFVGSQLGSCNGFANAASQITLANSEPSTAVGAAWRVIGKKAT